MKAFTGREFCRLLELHGWQLHRVSGSHHVYKHTALRLVVSVPVHRGRTLKRGLQHALLKAARIDAD